MIKVQYPGWIGRRLARTLAPPKRVAWLALLLCLALTGTSPAQFVISEFMAANNTTLNDEDGSNSDWIELHNEGTVTANLAGWFLTDTTNNMREWQFPATNIPPNGYIVVFASNKNRRTPGAPLHTNFKLSNDGEYLALVQPDGTNVASEFRPTFPPQVADISYGIVRETAFVTLLTAGAPARAMVPRNSDLGLTWTDVEFNDSTWTNGTTAIGYDRQTIGVNFLPMIGLNVEAMMYNSNQTAYVRVPFTVANPDELIGLTLRVRFDDGFVAYLNGQEIARSNAPVTTTWNSAALGPRTDTSATNYVNFDVTEFRSALAVGTNVLAFQALNNPLNSPDLLLGPELLGITPNGPPQLRYFPAPTPGRANSGGFAALGPIISEAKANPLLPGDGDDITVTARVRATFFPVGSASLHYRVMFGSEVTVPFLDDGAHGDGPAGDGVYGAVIPASASTPGQMVRWYITTTDSTGTNTLREPGFTSADSAAYFGTVISNPALSNPLPVFHWFVQNVPATDTATGTRCSVFYNGEFYDNLFCRVRGASAPTFPKKPYKFDFNPGDHFRFEPGMPRVDEINLNTTYQDKAYVRAPLTFETYRNSGVPACDAFAVRVQQNNAFYSIAVMVEQVDATFLDRRGLDPNGALYKVFTGITSATSGVEKKTRRTENNADLQQLVNAISVSNPNRAKDLFDLLDLPEIINYLASGTVSSDWDRVIKNIYLYRDSDGSGLWQMFPWDKDLSFGKVGLVNDTVTGNRDGTILTGGGEPYVNHPFYGIVEANCCGANNLMEAIYKTPLTREMYLRRLRTLIDDLLQAPGTPAAQLKYEARLNELFAQLQPDAALDLARWGAGYGVVQDLPTAMGLIKTNYLAPRRVHLFQTHSVDNVGIYAQAVGVPHAQVGSPTLQFGAVEFNPASANQAEEYVELLNPNPIAVDISGWRVAGGIDFTFAPGTVIPANGKLYLSPNIPAFRARTSGPRGGQGLFVLGNYSGQLSARGETLQLLDSRGAMVNSISYPGNPSPAQQFLRITEIMYHPAPVGGNTNTAEEFEFIELKNISPVATLDLRGVRFINGVEFDFTSATVTNLAPDGTVLVVRNTAQFVARYGAGHPIAGQYAGALDNNGERIQLIDAPGEEIHDFSYDQHWYPITDGLGFSLVIVDEEADPDLWNDKSNWRASGALYGSPGEVDPAPPSLPPIKINEVLSRTDTPPPVDSVELFNPTTNAVNIGGWFISDNFSLPKKFRIPGNTMIGAEGFLVFSEADFNPSGTGFAFSSLGEEVWLFSGDTQTNLSGYLHGFTFGAAENGVSFGRYVNSVGDEQFVPQSALTLNGTNAPPKMGPLVISEIMYHAPELGGADNSQREFVELQNISGETVALYDPSHPGNRWRLRGGIQFDFPLNIELPAGSTLLVVGFDPIADLAVLTDFRTSYGLGTNVAVLGPWSGKLNNSGDVVELYKPDAPILNTTPYILVEAVEYRDSDPWPIEADGGGSSLQRLVATAYGNDPINWFAAGRTPGSNNVFNIRPNVAISVPTNGSTFGQPANISIAVDASDSDGSVTVLDFFSDGQTIGTVGPPFSFTWSNAPAGTHLLTVRATDDRFATTLSTPISISVVALPPTVSIISPTNGALFLANSAIPITAAASDSDGFITKVEFYSGLTKLGEQTISPYLFSWTNAAPGQYTLTAVATDNGGFSVASSPLSISVLSGYASNVSVIATGASWKYFDVGISLGTSWRGTGYDDSTWASGPSPLGYGDGDEATVVAAGPDGGHYITTYFRRAITVTDAAAYSALKLRILRDDGAVVYLNGTEVFRTAMPDGPITFDTLANVTAVGADESTTYYEGVINPALLQDGQNIVAVEIHQVLPSSSDISFDLELTGTQTFLAPTISQHPATVFANVGANVIFNVLAAGTSPLTYQWRFKGTNLPGANQGILSLSNVPLNQSGVYSVTVSNKAGLAVSRDALLALSVADDYGQTINADGPIHYYRFEETSTSAPAIDAGIPGGFNGAYTGGIIVDQSTAPFRLGRAPLFNGNAGTFVNLGLFHPGDSVSVEAWVKLDNDARTGSYHAIIARWDGSYELDIAPDERANFVVRNEANTLGVVATDLAVIRGQWHHLVGIYDAGTLSIYLDGKLAGSTPLAGTLRNGGAIPDRVLIGGTRDGSNSSFNWKGLIDETAIYNRALTLDRIVAHYHVGLPLSRLAIGRAGVVTWPAYPSDTILQVTDSLRPPVQWENESSPRVQQSGAFQTSIPFTGTNRFYRLIKP